MATESDASEKTNERMFARQHDILDLSKLT